MKFATLLASLCAASIVTQTLAQTCSSQPLGAASNYNMFIFGNCIGLHDSLGNVAVGGNADFRSAGVGITGNLVVGGDLYANSGQVNGQLTLSGTKYAGQSFNIVGGTNPFNQIDFPKEKVKLLQLSQTYAKIPTTGTTTNKWGTIEFTGTEPSLNVFSVDESLLRSANGIKITVPSGSTALINVSGSAVQMQYFQIWVNGITRNSVIWNMPTATSLTMNGISIQGAILAPNAAINFSNGNFEGTLVGNSWTGSGEGHNYIFNGCLPPSSGGGSVGGDPHFRLHDGGFYSFHGECDLVMARSPSFDNGLGLDVHARTEMVGGTWSLVSNAANNGTHYINGVENAVLPTQLANKYDVTVHIEEIPGDEHVRTWYTIKLLNNEKVEVTNFRNMISVSVAAIFPDTVGMLGSSIKPGLIGRDGQTELVDPNEMGAQWQVNDEEAMLFNEIRSPQYPESCVLPEVSSTHRRLREADDGNMTTAKTACAGVADHLFEFCVYDVMISGNAGLARGYIGGVF